MGKSLLITNSIKGASVTTPTEYLLTDTSRDTKVSAAMPHRTLVDDRPNFVDRVSFTPVVFLISKFSNAYELAASLVFDESREYYA